MSLGAGWGSGIEDGRGCPAALDERQSSTCTFRWRTTRTGRGSLQRGDGLQGGGDERRLRASLALCSGSSRPWPGSSRSSTSRGSMREADLPPSCCPRREVLDDNTRALPTSSPRLRPQLPRKTMKRAKWATREQRDEAGCSLADVGAAEVPLVGRSTEEEEVSPPTKSSRAPRSGDDRSASSSELNTPSVCAFHQRNESAAARLRGGVSTPRLPAEDYEQVSKDEHGRCRSLGIARACSSTPPRDGASSPPS